MAKTFLTAVFAFNRGQLLGNCVESIERFYPESEIVVFDDRSDDQFTKDVLSQIRKRGHSIVENTEEKVAPHGNLFSNMTRALNFARTNRYRLVHLMQEDTQFVWRNTGLVEHVTQVFDSFSDAYQVQIHFAKRLGVSEIALLRKSRAYRFGIGGDLGFVDAERLLRHDFEFKASERYSAQVAAARGLQSYGLADPVVARVPWPKNFRYREMRGGREKASSAQLLIKPLDEDAVKRLTARDIQKRPYGEDWYVPWGWRCWRPYPTDPSRTRWAKAMLKVAIQRRSLRGLLPTRVGDAS